MKWASERVGVARGGRSGAVVQQNVAECVTRWRCVREWREVLCVYGTILSANNNNRRTDVSLIQHCITDTGRAESTQHAACSSTPGASSNSSSSSLPPPPAPFMPIALRSKLRAEYNHRIPGEEGSSDRVYLPPPPTTLRPDTLPPW